MSRRIGIRGGALFGVAALAIACGGGDSTGLGEDELRKDAFDRPTQHGELRFGEAHNEAAFTDDQRFHAWAFTLTDNGTVDVKTELLAPNLDTVLYVYRRDPGTSAWGEYIATNDDSNRTIASRVKKKLGAGEYLVKVKASKTALRGAFRVAATCTGKGCPTVDASCTVGTFLALPDNTGYGVSCTNKIDAVLSAPETSSGGTSAKLSTKCPLAPLERTALDYYHQWWDDIVGWDDFIGGDDADPELGVRTESHGAAGTLVTVDYPYDDESAMTFVFDGAGKLLLGYQHNQSPTVDWYCKDAGEPSATDPGESCVGEAISEDGARPFTCR